MRKQFVNLAAAALILAGATVSGITARADGGGAKLVVTDGRYDPFVEDRVAVYLNEDHIEVWGINGDSTGVYLTRFSKAEIMSGAATHVTPAGTVSISLTKAATFVTGYKDDSAQETVTEIDESAEYTISWKGGAEGATGAGAFAKTVAYTYLD